MPAPPGGEQVWQDQILVGDCMTGCNGGLMLKSHPHLVGSVTRGGASCGRGWVTVNDFLSAQYIIPCNFVVFYVKSAHGNNVFTC